MAEVAVRSCVHAGKVFFSVCFTGGQGYRGGKRNAWQEAREEEMGREFYVPLLPRGFPLFLSIYLSVYLSISVFSV